MDRFLYISMSGAKENMNGLSLHANNMANANKTAFKSSFEQARSMQAYGEGMPTRVFSLAESPGQNFESGVLQQTGRDLDLAIEGNGWFVVDSKLNGEALTRAGNFNINSNGFLVDKTGQNVLKENGEPIYIELPIEKLNIRRDGVIEVRPEGAPANAMEEVAQLKLVSPDIRDLARGEDGLFRRIDGNKTKFAVDVQIQSGTLEASNVNLSAELTGMINLQRQFEMQVKMMKTAEEIDQSTDSLLRIV